MGTSRTACTAAKVAAAALTLVAAVRVGTFVDARRAAWQACARWLATTAETRAAPPTVRWEGVLEPLEDRRPDVAALTGFWSARLRFPVLPGVGPWPGVVRVSAPRALEAGASTLWAEPRCEAPTQNGTDGDFFAAFRLPTLRLVVRRVTPRSPRNLCEWAGDTLARARQRAGLRLRPWPRTFGVARAAWTGELGALPETWRVVFRDGGALAVVALSGQHVALVAGWLLWVLGFFGRWLPPRGFAYARTRAFLPSAVATGFVALGGFAPSTVRAAATVYATAFLRRRGLDVSATRIAVVTAAATIVVEPAFVAAPGYLLSVGGAVLLARILDGARDWRTAVAVMVLLPCALAPLVVYCFARLPLLAIVAGTAVGFLWEGIVLPLAFFAMPLAMLLPARAFAALAEATEHALVAVENGLARVGPCLAETVVVLPVPTPFELLCLYGALGCLLMTRRVRFSRADTSTLSSRKTLEYNHLE